MKLLLFLLFIFGLILPDFLTAQDNNMLIIRYHRYEGDYGDWQLWTWNKTKNHF